MRSTPDGKKTSRRTEFTDFPWSDPSLGRHIVFVGLLPRRITHKKLIPYFSSFGRVVWLEVFPPSSGDEYAYAHLLFDSLDAVDRLFAKSGHRIKGANIRVRMWRTPKSESHSEAQLNRKKVFVKNICPRTTAAGLRKYFEVFGAVAHVEQGPRPRGACSATAHVVFESPESAASCLAATHQRIDGFKIKCKHFVPATSEQNEDSGESLSAQDSDASSLSAGAYSALIDRLEKDKLLALRQESLQSLGGSHQGPPARRTQPTSKENSGPLSSEEDCSSRPRPVQRTFTSGQSKEGEHQAHPSGTSAARNQEPQHRHSPVPVTVLTDSLANSTPEPMIVCSMWRPVFVNFYVVAGYM